VRRPSAAEVAKAVPVGSFAVVMGTGIVSTALSLDKHEAVSRALLAVAGVTWGGLVVILAWRFVSDRQRLLDEARSPAGLSGVAANAVLGTRLLDLGWVLPGIAFLVVAFALWLVLLGPVLRRLPKSATGSAFMLTVSTEALAVLVATLATSENAPWLMYSALLPALLGIGFYPLALARFDMCELSAGRGDQWVAGGAIAISALAVGQITQSAIRLAMLGGAITTLRVAALCLWAVAVLWLPVLLVAEARQPRMRYDLRRWSTVFPLGMYAACSFSVSAVTRTAAVSDFARVWVWLAVIGWTVTLAAMLGRGTGARA
jgi:tellurite resistance protein TehA-like permease